MEPDVQQPRLPISLPTKVLTGLLVTVMVVFGVFPHHLLEVARAAAKMLL
jgi:hypothetical protein